MIRTKCLTAAVLLFACLSSGLSGQDAGTADPVEIIRRAERIMYPDAKAVARLHFVSPDGRTEDYEALYYARDRNQKIIVRMIAPPAEAGNDLLMIEQNVWAYERRINRVMKVPSNQSFGGTGFSYGDVVRLNFSDNYTAALTAAGNETFTLELIAKERAAPYYRILLDVSREGGWPMKGVCFARNGSVVKEIRYSEIRDIGAGKKPVVVTVTSPLDPGAVNTLTLVTEEPRNLPDRVFNRRNLEARLEEAP
ncbi:MAG TPA: outer membrane lipoprotein-sorting protein [Spirochaetia bacterium]|nr:outer membrane lipoprotein-sorting protein [Spirochaetia bacterium]